MTWDERSAYIGLESTASMNRFNDLSQCWSTDMFLGNRDFVRVMSRTTFKDIGANIRLYPYYDCEAAAENPLLHSEVVLEHSSQNVVSVAVPTSVNSLDENKVRCKGRTQLGHTSKVSPSSLG